MRNELVGLRLILVDEKEASASFSFKISLCRLRGLIAINDCYEGNHSLNLGHYVLIG